MQFPAPNSNLSIPAALAAVLHQSDVYLVLVGSMRVVLASAIFGYFLDESRVAYGVLSKVNLLLAVAESVGV